MNYRHIRSGIFFISIGIVFLLINFGVVSGGSILRTLLQYWPALFILIGMNIIFRKNEIAKSIIWLVFLALLVSFSYYNWYAFENRSGSLNYSSNVEIKKSSGLENGILKIGLGGSRILIDSSTSNLLDAYVSEDNVLHKEYYIEDNKTAIVEFKNNENVFIWPGSREENRFSLSKETKWDIDINSGVASGILDMSNLIVEKLNLNTGAASFELIFGSRSKMTEAVIKAGASSFDIVVPRDSGVKVDVKGVLTGDNLEELKWDKQGDFYVSPNYNSAENKINLYIDIGVGRFDILIR